jgi:hypothetical protein
MTPLALIPHSTFASTPQLYAARYWLEREGRTPEVNALSAFLDKHQPPTIIRGATVQEGACGRSVAA